MTESLGTEILLYLFEEQLSLPATFVQFEDGHCWDGNVVGHKHQGLVCHGIVKFDPTQLVRFHEKPN